MFEASTWGAGNNRGLIQKVAKTVNVISHTGAASLSACNAAVGIVYRAQNYACQDYKCLCLDTVTLTCNSIATIASFIPGVIKIFAASTALSYFCRTLRNKCKEKEGGIFRCN